MILHIEDNEPSISFAEGIGGCVFWPIVGFLLANKGLFSIRKRLFERKTHG